MSIDIATLESPRDEYTGVGHNPCLLCGKEIQHGKEGGWVHVGEGGSVILANGERSASGFDEDGYGGMGWFPVGSACIRKIPKAYRW